MMLTLSNNIQDRRTNIVRVFGNNDGKEADFLRTEKRLKNDDKNMNFRGRGAKLKTTWHILCQIHDWNILVRPQSQRTREVARCRLAKALARNPRCSNPEIHPVEPAHEGRAARLRGHLLIMNPHHHF